MAGAVGGGGKGEGEGEGGLGGLQCGGIRGVGGGGTADPVQGGRTGKFREPLDCGLDGCGEVFRGSCSRRWESWARGISMVVVCF